MIYKTFGKTGKQISALGFGGLKFTKDDIEKNDMRESIEAVKTAYKSGINYFDTAPLYCDGKSEIILGLALNEFNRNTYYISTKNTSYMTGDTTAYDFRKRIEQSLVKLKTNKIDFYYLWGMNDLEIFKYHTLGNESLLSVLLKAKDEGIIEHICFSSHAVAEDIKIMADTGYFEGLILSYSIIKHLRYAGLIDYLKESGVAVIAMNPLFGGAIPQNPDYFSFLKRDGLNSVQSSLRYVMSNPGITCALSGMKNSGEVYENVESAQKLFDKEVLASMNSAFKEEDLKLCTACKYCDVCPVGIPVYKYMEAYNINVLFSGYSVKRHLLDFWNIKEIELSKCIKCGKCEKMCTQKLPILERFKEFSHLK